MLRTGSLGIENIMQVLLFSSIFNTQKHLIFDVLLIKKLRKKLCCFYVIFFAEYTVYVQNRIQFQ